MKRTDKEDTRPEPATERLQKVMAGAGLGSRRSLETRIDEGGVLVNGKKASLGRSVKADDRILFVRPAAGTEFEFGPVRIFTLGPSLDLRNRFDTYGVDRNNASIVLKVQYRNSVAILTGDAEFDSWGKVAEEFPRQSKITYFKDASVIRSEGDNQLNCQLLKVSHHGSKHGTSLEYLEKLSPTHLMVTCADKDWYDANEPGWGNQWPHGLTAMAISEVNSNAEIRYSYIDKNVVYSLTGTKNLKVNSFAEIPDEDGFEDALRAVLD